MAKRLKQGSPSLSLPAAVLDIVALFMGQDQTNLRRVCAGYRSKKVFLAHVTWARHANISDRLSPTCVTRLEINVLDLLRLITQNKHIFPSLQEVHCVLDQSWDRQFSKVVRTLDTWISGRESIKTVSLTYNYHHARRDEAKSLHKRLQTRGGNLMLWPIFPVDEGICVGHAEVES